MKHKLLYRILLFVLIITGTSSIYSKGYSLNERLKLSTNKTVEKVTVESEEDFLTLKNSEPVVKETKQNEASDTGDKNENIEDGTKDDESSDEVGDEDADDATVYRSLANDLKTNGIITSDFTEEEITDGESFLEIFEKEVNSRLEEEVKNYAEGFDDDGRAYLEYIKNGGTTVDFVKLFVEFPFCR